MDIFVKRLQLLLDENNINQKELAKKVGVTEVTISRYMTGERKPRIDIANKMAEILSTTTDYLMGTSDIRNPYEGKVIKKEEQDIVPEEFTSADEARAYVNKHQIFGSGGFDADKLDDNEILEFANALLEQMKMVSYKYKK
ncbi:helix-turn-helix transcriptional regulator [Tissierella praeacuta]|uniref:helix-turn-helix domain-containing protein n=1 Tax=Tissierella praeacuta TaxID=43131 RepID=UPI003341CC7E